MLNFPAGIEKIYKYLCDFSTKNISQTYDVAEFACAKNIPEKMQLETQDLADIYFISWTIYPWALSDNGHINPEHLHEIYKENNSLHIMIETLCVVGLCNSKDISNFRKCRKEITC